MQAVLEQKLVTGPIARKTADEGMRKVGFFSSLFGCWHPHLTRPISDKNSTYQSCVECGARRQFSMERFTSTGPFYYPAKVETEQTLSA